MDPNTNNLIVGGSIFSSTSRLLRPTAGVIVSGDELAIHGENLTVYSDEGITSVFSINPSLGETSISGDLNISGVTNTSTFNSLGDTSLATDGGSVNISKIESMTTILGKLTVDQETILNNLTINNGNIISIGDNIISNVANPTENQDAATKFYVDSVASGLDIKNSCRVATTEEVNIQNPITEIDSINITNGD